MVAAGIIVAPGASRADWKAGPGAWGFCCQLLMWTRWTIRAPYPSRDAANFRYAGVKGGRSLCVAILKRGFSPSRLPARKLKST